MAIIRRVLGHLALETAGHKRKCHRNAKKHSILMNEVCLTISSGRFEKKNYCRECAADILRTADSDLRELLRQLNITL